MVPGLLFADDAVATTPSLDSLERMLDHLSEWARDHFMGFGILKCGLMALGRHSDPSALRARAPQLLLGGLPVPVVDEYRYLGVTIRSDMSVPHILADRLAKGQRAVAALRHFLSRGGVPLSMRSLVLKFVCSPSSRMRPRCGACAPRATGPAACKQLLIEPFGASLV